MLTWVPRSRNPISVNVFLSSRFLSTLHSLIIFAQLFEPVVRVHAKPETSDFL